MSSFCDFSPLFVLQRPASVRVQFLEVVGQRGVVPFELLGAGPKKTARGVCASTRKRFHTIFIHFYPFYVPRKVFFLEICV